MALIDVAKYDIKDGEFVGKFPSTDLPIGTQLVVHPAQMEVTKAILENKFSLYNNLYFNNKLTKPKFFFLNDKKVYGRILYGSRDGNIPSEIWISKTLNVEYSILKDTLIHEMIHQYIYERLYGSKYNIISHGIRFRYFCWQLYKRHHVKIKRTSLF